MHLERTYLPAQTTLEDILADPRHAEIGREPFYILDVNALRQQAQCFCDGFPGDVSYAVKANPDPLILETLYETGLRHFDVASMSEVELVAETLGDKPYQLYFHNPVKDSADIYEAYTKYGIKYFVAASINEFRKIQNTLPQDPDIVISVRLAVDSGQSAFGENKLGASLDEAKMILLAVAAAGMKPALYFHVGSQCADPNVYQNALRYVQEICRDLNIMPDHINVGGGFPVNYSDAAVPPLSSFFDAIRNAARQGIRLLAEPGRALVAPSEKLVAKIIRCDADGITLNTGVKTDMAEFAEAEGAIIPPHHILGAAPAAMKPFIARGPTCHSDDVLPFPLQLPTETKEGDIVVFDDMGAYVRARGVDFNGLAAKKLVILAARKKHYQRERGPASWLPMAGAVAASLVAIAAVFSWAHVDAKLARAERENRYHQYVALKKEKGYSGLPHLSSRQRLAALEREFGNPGQRR